MNDREREPIFKPKNEAGRNDAVRSAEPAAPPWKVLMVDDEEEVHRATRWVFRRLDFDERPIEFLSARSAEEAKVILNEHPDIAIILLDVVMEQEDAGLKLVHYIRQELNNKMIRIILRTGQPGQAPEIEVMRYYDINDYKEKTELTSEKLFTTIISGLRSYRDLSIIDHNRKGLQKIIESLSGIYEIQSISKLASGALEQLAAVLRLGPDALYGTTSASGMAVSGSVDGEFKVLAATGDYGWMIGKTINGGVPQQVLQDIDAVLQQKHTLFFPNRFVVYFRSRQGSDNIIYMEGIQQLNEWERDLVEVFCMNVSVAFDNVQLNQEIVATQKEIIFTLGEVAEARSYETGQHVKRVAEYAKLLAVKYGLPTEEAELLRLAAPTHDVGKLAIADAILHKPAKLTAEEFAAMKAHCEVGHKMLFKSDRSLLRNGALIAKQHHEKWDGTGYPEGLIGEQIHIYGRIVALADVFDALGSHRVYKQPWPLDEILDYIKVERGRHFDPKLVDIFFDNLEEILAIRKAYPDETDEK
ncbi:MAG: DUF3369 domain-containing protein [Solirubrobacterales bacterium]